MTQVPRLHEVRKTEQQTIALVRGEAVRDLPTDLYIPPEALEVFLETFEGPLDLLLYLIRRENLDILDIKVAAITEQYMSYVELMKAMQLDLAGEYLVMAAMLAEIKSRMLLPRPVSDADDEDDPRAELIRRLQEYEQIKGAAERIEALPRLERDIHLVRAERPALVRHHADPDVDLKELLLALAQVLRRAEMFERHSVQLEALSVRERMSYVLEQVNAVHDFVPFEALFSVEEGRMGVVVTFLALLELMRESLLELVQNEPYAPIYVRAARGAEDAGITDDSGMKDSGTVE
jgi:segregation and condensation protein A